MFLVSSEQQSSLLTEEETLAKGQGTGCFQMNCYFVHWMACCHKVSLKGLLTFLLSQSQNDISTINWKHEN